MTGNTTLFVQIGGHRSLAWFTRDQIGLRALAKRLLKGEEYSIEDEDVQRLAELTKQNAARLKNSSGEKLSIIKIPPTKIVGELLSQLGLSTKSRRLGVRGNRVRFYCLNCDDVAFNFQVLDHRQRKLQEKERRRRQEQEDNERHRSVLQTRYGIGTSESQATKDSQPVSTPPQISAEKEHLGGCGHEENVAHCTDKEQLVTQEQLQRLKRIASLSADKTRIFFDWVFERLNLDSIDQLTQSMYDQIMEDFAFASF